MPKRLKKIKKIAYDSDDNDYRNDESQYNQSNLYCIKSDKINEQNNQIQSSQIKTQYNFIKGKKQGTNGINYLVELNNGEAQWVEIQQLQDFWGLVRNYEQYQSRLLFNQLWDQQLKNQQLDIELEKQILSNNSIDQQQQINKEQHREEDQQLIDNSFMESLDFQKNCQEELKDQLEQQQTIQTCIPNKEKYIGRKYKSYVEEQITYEEPDVFITKIVQHKSKKNNYVIGLDDNHENGQSSYQPLLKVGKMAYQVTDRLHKKQYGSFEYDVPSHISNHKMEKGTFDNIQNKANKYKIIHYLYKLQWKRRESGYLPLPSYYTYQEMKKYAPRILLEYLEQLSQLLR